MDRALAALTLAGIGDGILALNQALYWLLAHALDTIDRIRRTP